MIRSPLARVRQTGRAGSGAAALTAVAARRDEAAAAAERLRIHVWDVYDVDRNAARLLEAIGSSLRD